MRLLARRLVFAAVLLSVGMFCSGLAVAQSAALDSRQVEIVASPEVKLLDQEGAGKLYQVGGHLMVVMEGTPEEMGFQHGRLLAKKIHHIIKEGYMAKALWGRGYTPEYVAAQSDRMEKHFPESIKEEIRGIVKGLKAAGVDDLEYADVRIGVTHAEIMHFPADEPPQSCSNFAVWGKWTTDGRLLHGRNLDWDVKGGAQEDAVVLVWRPKGGAPFMMPGWAGSVGSVSGMSARGITIGEMTLPSKDATFDGLPLFLQMRLVLEKAATLDEAVKMFQEYPRTTGWNFILGDGKAPDGRALETDAKYCNVFTPMDEKEGAATGHWGMEDCVRRTNHPTDLDQLFRLARAFGDKVGLSVETKEQLTVLVPMLQGQNSFQRYEWMSRRIEEVPGKIDVEQAVKILATGPVYCDATLHSWVFDPKNHAAYLSVAGYNPPVTATDRPFTKIDLTEWFK